MPCYLFKGLVFAEEAMFLTSYGDLITYFIYHPNDQLFNAITMGFSQLVSLVKACQLSMFSSARQVEAFGFSRFTFRAPNNLSQFSNSPSFPLQLPLELCLLRFSGLAAWEVF